MTKIIGTIMIVLLANFAFSQSADSSKIRKDNFNNYDELKEKQKKAGIDILTYVDSIFNYQVKVPNWLHLKETGSKFIWGGTLPPVDSIENAIAIKSFDKKKYKSLIDFENYVVNNLVVGQSPSWSSTHKFMGKKELGKYKDIGDAYKVYLLWGNMVYHCEYILLETKTAYLWIDYTSTEGTFDKNLNKFNEFMDGFSTTSFTN
jgi:hypothetical protein